MSEQKRFTAHTPGHVHLRSAESGEGESRVIEGYAIIFNERSLPMWRRDDGKPCYEVVAPEAITDELLDRSDIRLTLFHDDHLILGRTVNGDQRSLKYIRDDKGVKFECDLPKTADGDKALELVRRGEIDGCSFAFATDYWDKACVDCNVGEGETIYTVRQIFGLFDFTLTPDPAYPATEVAARQAPRELEDAPVVEEETNNLTPIEMENEVRDYQTPNGAVEQPVQQRESFSFDRAERQIREAMSRRENIEVRFTRDIMTTEGVAGTGIIPVLQQEILKPLREGLIWDKLGINVATGLYGELRWPLHTKATAAFAGEIETAVSSSIDFSKLTMDGHRLALTIAASRTELNDSQGQVERVITEEMPAACVDKINAAMLTIYAEEKVGSAIVTKPVVGPFAQSANNTARNCAIVELGDSITRKKLLEMKARVVSAGVDMKAPAFVMNENTKAELEDTKVDAGSGRFLCEGDRILGYPVLTSSEIPDGIVGFGDFSYQAAGYFGSPKLIVDPYTLADKDSVKYVLNLRFGTVTLRKEAFVLGRTTAAKTKMTTYLTGVTES